jgi:hypothetical protein
MTARVADTAAVWLKVFGVEVNRAAIAVLSRFALDILDSHKDALISRGCWHLREQLAAAMVVFCWLGSSV